MHQPSLRLSSRLMAGICKPRKLSKLRKPLRLWQPRHLHMLTLFPPCSELRPRVMRKSESCGLYNNDVSTRNQKGVHSGNCLPLLPTTQTFRAEERKWEVPLANFQGKLENVLRYTVHLMFKSLRIRIPSCGATKSCARTYGISRALSFYHDAMLIAV